MLKKLQDIEIIVENEPVNILEQVDKLSDEDKKRLFPNYEEFIKSESRDILPLLKMGIRNDEIIEGKNYRGVRYNTIHFSNMWNNVGILYMNNKMYEKGRDVYSTLIDVGVYDSSTITNYAAVIMRGMLEKHVIEESDEPDFEYVKKLLYDAFIFDVEAKPRKKADAVLLPAYKNLIYVRNIESELYYNKKLYFISFILGWISVEMSLIRIFCRIMKHQKGEKIIREKLSMLNIQTILDILYGFKIITKELYTEINSINKERNKLIHGSEIEPTPGLTKQVIDLGRKLIPLYNP